MKRKPRWTLEMLTAGLAVLCGLLLLVLLVQRPTAWPLLAVLVVLWGIGATLFRCKLRRWVVRWTSGTTFEKSKVQFSLEPLSQPAALLSGETVLWYNSQFRTRLLGGQDVLASRVQKLLPGLDLQLCRKREGQLLTLADGYWSVHSSTVPGEAESVTLLVLNEETELRRIEAEYKASRPGYLAFQLDGYDDVFGDLMDSERARLLEGVNRILEDMIGRGSGFLRRVGSGGRYIAVVEERQLEQFANRGYDVLDKIRALDPGVSLSMSIGIGRGADTLTESEQWARQALDMALGRGGDQVAVKKKNDAYDFFGGLSKGVEKRDKVRTRVIAASISDHMKASDIVFIMGHQFSDLDAVGSAVGMWSAATKGAKKPAYIVIDRNATMAMPIVDEIEAAHGPEETIFISEEEALDMMTQRSLVIVVDTHSPDFVESKELLNEAQRVVVIDHHRMMVKHINNAVVFYHEPYASSASEMVSELVQYIGNTVLSKEEADALLAGIMLDTKNFVLKSGVRTFEAAAYLRRRGADTVVVKKMFASNIDTYKEKYSLISTAEVYNGCAIACTDESTPNVRVAAAQAADELLSIQGVNASFVLFKTGKTVNISARSLGDINVQIIIEAMGGGGHLTMAGAQKTGMTMDEVKKELIQVIRDILPYASKFPALNGSKS